jgi:hypothetical protein
MRPRRINESPALPANGKAGLGGRGASSNQLPGVGTTAGGTTAAGAATGTSAG